MECIKAYRPSIQLVSAETKLAKEEKKFRCRSIHKEVLYSGKDRVGY